MAQFNVLSLEFPLPQSDDDRAELRVIIDNPQNMKLAEDPQHGNLPDNVEVVAEGGTPSQEFWVYEDDYHLTITLEPGSGSDPLQVSNTGFYNQGDNPKYVDIIVAEKTPDDKKKAREVRRRGVILSV